MNGEDDRSKDKVEDETSDDEDVEDKKAETKGDPVCVLS